MGNCFHCYNDVEYKEHIEKVENPEKIEKVEKNDNIDLEPPNSSPKIELERTQSVDINIILNQLIDTYNQEHPKPPKPEKKEPEIIFTVKRMNCRINI